MIALLAFAAKNRALIGWGVGVAAILAIAATLYLAGRHAGVSAEAPKVAAAQAQAVTAQSQAVVTTQAAKAADTAATRGVHATAQAEEAAHAVQTTPGASDALPPDLLARWHAGVDGLRAPPASAADRADR